MTKITVFQNQNQEFVGFECLGHAGYTRLIAKMYEGADIVLDTDFLKDKEHWEDMADKVFYSGCIDEYYDYCYGPLEYRSVRFETEVFDKDNYQGNAVVNYTSDEEPYTRIIEHKHWQHCPYHLWQDRGHSHPHRRLSWLRQNRAYPFY